MSYESVREGIDLENTKVVWDCEDCGHVFDDDGSYQSYVCPKCGSGETTHEHVPIEPLTISPENKTKKKLWGRLGAEIDLDEQELDLFTNACRKGNGLLASSLIESWFSNGRFKLSGETYFPNMEGKENSSRYDNPKEELSVDN